MTDKTDAQPEALRVAAWLINAPFKTTHGDMLVGGRELRRLYAETEAQAARIAELEAQLSARQAAPDGGRLVPELPTLNMLNTAFGICTENGRPVQQMIEAAAEKYAAMLSAAPPTPEREQLAVDGTYTITIECGAAQARFVITEMQIETAPSPAEYVGHAVSKAFAAIDKRRVSHGIGATND